MQYPDWLRIIKCHLKSKQDVSYITVITKTTSQSKTHKYNCTWLQSYMYNYMYIRRHWWFVWCVNLCLLITGNSSIRVSFGVSTRNLKHFETTVCNADFKQQIKCQLQQAHGYPFFCFRMKPSNESSSYKEVQM